MGASWCISNEILDEWNTYEKLFESIVTTHKSRSRGDKQYGCISSVFRNSYNCVSVNRILELLDIIGNHRQCSSPYIDEDKEHAFRDFIKQEYAKDSPYTYIEEYIQLNNTIIRSSNEQHANGDYRSHDDAFMTNYEKNYDKLMRLKNNVDDMPYYLKNYLRTLYDQQNTPVPERYVIERHKVIEHYAYLKAKKAKQNAEIKRKQNEDNIRRKKQEEIEARQRAEKVKREQEQQAKQQEQLDRQNAPIHARKLLTDFEDWSNHHYMDIYVAERLYSNIYKYKLFDYLGKKDLLYTKILSCSKILQEKIGNYKLNEAENLLMEWMTTDVTDLINRKHGNEEKISNYRYNVNRAMELINEYGNYSGAENACRNAKIAWSNLCSIQKRYEEAHHQCEYQKKQLEETRNAHDKAMNAIRDAQWQQEEYQRKRNQEIKDAGDRVASAIKNAQWYN